MSYFPILCCLESKADMTILDMIQSDTIL